MGARRLLVGPLGPGSTFTVLAAAAEAARAGRRHLVVLPARAAMEHARNESARRAGLCDPRSFVTFHGLARHLLGPRAPRPAGRRAKDAALVEALRSVDGPERDLALRFRGFRDGLLRVLEEVEAAGLPPEQLLGALRRARLDEPRAARLTATYRAWRAALHARGLSTEADLLREAAAALPRGREHGLPSLVLLDGFTDLTGRQMDLLAALSLKVEETVLTWPCAPEGVATAAFAGPDRVRGRLVDELGFVVEPRPEAPAHLRRAGPARANTGVAPEEPRPAALERLATALFAPPAERPPLAPDPAALRVVRAASRRDEVEAALGRARAFVTEAPGRRWTDVLVVVPEVRRYRRDLERVGAELGVPVRVRGPVALSQVPVVQGALALLRAAATWDGPALLAAAACPALGLDPDEADRLARHARRRGLPARGRPGAFEALAADAGGEAGELVLRVVALGRALERAVAGDPTTRAGCRLARAALGAALRPVAGPRLGDRPEPETVAEAAHEAEARRELLDLLADLEGLAVPLDAPRARATATPAGAPLPATLAGPARSGSSPAELREASPSTDDQASELGEAASSGAIRSERLRPERSEAGIGPAQLVARVEEELRATEVEPLDRRRHVLHVVDAREARSWEADLVLVLGLAEGEWPRPAKDDLVLPEGARRLLGGRRGPGRPAPGLRTARDRAEEEAFLFYAAVTRARRELWLLWTGFSAGGAPRPCSRFVDEVRTLLGEQAWTAALVARTPADVVPDDPARLYTLDHVRRFAWRRVAAVSRPTGPEAEKARLAAALLGRLLERPEERLRAAAALRRPDAQTLAVAPGRRALDRVYSASELEAYATCPYQHFVKHLLRVRVEEDLTLRGIDARKQGEVVHAALRGTLEQGVPLATAFEAAFTQAARDLEVGLEEDAFRRTALASLQKFTEEDDPAFRRVTGATPHAFEVPFGLGRPGEGQPGPLEIPMPALGGTIRVGGQIDRIDLLPAPVARTPGAPAPPAAASTPAAPAAGAGQGAAASGPPPSSGGAGQGAAPDAQVEAVAPRLAPPPARRAGFVLDYKLGGREVDGRYLDGMHRGEKLQVPVYLLALDRVFGLEPAGAAFAALGTRRRTGVVDPAIGAAWGRNGLDEDRRVRLFKLPVRTTLNRAEEHIRRIVAGIADGVIEPAPSDAGECDRCQAKDVCRLEPWESRRRARRGRGLPVAQRPAPVALAAAAPQALPVPSAAAPPA